MHSLDQFPKGFSLAFVKNTAFVGSASTYLFHFHLYDRTNLVLFVNGVPNPSEPLIIDCSSTFGATRAYEILFSSRVSITTTVFT